MAVSEEAVLRTLALFQKNSLQRKCFGAINFVKIAKESLYKTNSLACFLAKKGHATLQGESSGGIIFVIATKFITKESVPRNSFVIIFARIRVRKKGSFGKGVFSEKSIL